MTFFLALLYVFVLLVILQIFHIPFVIIMDKIIKYYNNKKFLD